MDTPQTPATPAPAKPAAPATTAPAVAKTDEPTQEFVVNGKPVKLTAAQVKIAVQKGLFADQQLKSVDVLKKSTEALLSKLKTPEGIIEILKDKSIGNSPQAVLDKLLDSDVIDDATKEKVSKWVYDRVVKPGKMTPEQIEQEKKLSDYERLKKQEEARRNQEEQAKSQQQIQQVYQAVRAEVTKQIVADKTFPQTEGSIRAVVEKLRVMNKKGVPITPENVTKAIGLVKNDHIAHQTALLDAIEDPEKLIALFGEERALKISRALVARIQAKQKAASQDKAPEPDGMEKVTEKIDKKLGKTRQGYHILNV